MNSIRIARVAVLCSAILMVAAATNARADQKLRWKFEKGEQLNYVLDRAIDGTMNINGNELKLGMNMAFDVTWNVQEVDSDGSATIGLTVDRIQMKAKMPFPGMPDIELDSAQLPEEDNPIIGQIKPLLDGMLNQAFTMNVSPLGGVTDIEFPDALKQMFGGDDEQEGGDGQRRGRRGGGGGLPGLDTFSEKGIQQIIRQMVLPLPEDAVNDDVTWTQTFENEEPGAGIQTTETTFSYAGEADKDGAKLVKLEAETELFFDPAEEATTEVELGDQEGQATILFDAVTGHLVESVGTQMFVKTMDTRRGSVEQSITEKVTMRLGKSPAPEPKEESPKDES